MALNDPADAALWSGVGFCEYQAIEEWRKDNFPSLSREDALACELRTVETTVHRKPFGNISVTVSVISRKPGKSCLRYFSFRKVANKVYKRVDTV